MYGGNGRTNASISVNSNASLTVGTTYYIDVSAGAMLMILPVTGKQSSTYYSFTYKISGSGYSWWESLIVGPNGKKYFIIGIVCAAVIGALILAGTITVIVKCCCCRNKGTSNKVKVNPNDQSNFSSRPLDNS